MITAKRRAPPAKTALEDAESGMDSDKSREIDEVAPKKSKPKQPAKKAAEDLFSSSEDSDYMVGAPIELTTQRARWATRDSDDELHEAIADALVRIPLDARSRRSSTGSGWSSGRDLTIPDSEPESDAVSEPEVPQPRTKKVSAARQKKADLEKPEVRPAPAPAAAPSNSAIVAAADRPEASWDRSTRLVLPAPNKDIGLTAQHPEVQLMLRGTIDAQRMDLMIEDFYPTMITRVGFIRPKMIAAADIHPSTTHVKQRLMVDPKFAAILAPIPLDRINIQRGDVKRCAVSIVISMYRLNDLTPAEIKARVEELLKDHRYIFPVDPITGQMQLSLPFHHGSIKLVIKDQMMSSTVFKNRNYDRLPARHPKHPTAREVADPMVAMGATAIYASLLELRMTGERQPIAFTEDAFEDIYRIHIKTLEDTRAAAPIAMHKVLHQLFRDVTTSAQAVQTVAGSSATLISLVDVPNSD
ncbi:hypothetical protein C8R44DRAFT_329878 [Mycena epipterygia]|nr:hypothetical protein C8R44DRAFT_329878 [Mycena epipterygia]